MIDRRLLKTQALTLCLFATLSLTTTHPIQAAQSKTTEQPSNNVLAIIDRGIYWFERYRYDLATQAFNKVLLVEPNQPEALKWKGLIDLNSGNARSAQIWLEQLTQTSGSNHPQAVELKQSVEIATRKRQKIAEIEFLANRGAPADQWLPSLNGLFQEPPLDEAAVLYYTLFAGQSEADKEFARRKVRGLISKFPRDQRYSKLLTDLGGNLTPQPQATVIARKDPPVRTNPPATQRKSSAKQERVAREKPKAKRAIENSTPDKVEAAEINGFEKGQQLSAQAQQLIDANQVKAAVDKLQQAIELNPTYAWFRYDLATLLDDQQTPEDENRAKLIMQNGLDLAPKDTDMAFASALLASRQEDPDRALELLSSIEKSQWTQGMSAMDRRLRYRQYLETLDAYQQSGQFNQMPAVMVANRQWNSEPEAREYIQELRNRKTTAVEASWQTDTIDGDVGVSRIESRELALEVSFALDYESRIFFRGDQVEALAGDYSLTPDFGNLTDFGSLGTNTTAALRAGQTNPNLLPAGFQQNKNQNFEGHLIGVGWRNDDWRVDIGKPVGDFPVDSWVGGVRWSTDLGNSTVRFDLARRIVGGSVLSSVGAIDPGTGRTWGGARRNGLTGLIYTPLPYDSSFVGIARINSITGKELPSNRELNLQLIYSKEIYSDDYQTVELGMSGFFWKFQRNMRLYTFGQGGYYSPQDFKSYTLPITWTGSRNNWSWRLQGSVGESRSKENPTDLYPNQPEIRAQVLAAGNAVIDQGGFGGGDSYGISYALERRLSERFVIGLRGSIDRSEGYNPDSFSFYLRYFFDGKAPLFVPPEGLTPYSQF